MVQAWVFEENGEDPRNAHRSTENHSISLAYLAKLGVLYWKVEPQDVEQDGVLQRVRQERNYKNADVIEVSPTKLANYEDKIRTFFEEHLHDDEEIRLVLDGSGYFDVKDEFIDRWIRISMVPGDLIVLPAGIFHRFTMDTKNYIKAMRLFQAEPKWTAHNRSLPETSSRDCRKNYLKLLQDNSEVHNGAPVILGTRAKALANYPHARVVGGLVYFSGTSSRRPDNTHVGASQNPDGTWDLDIRLQTQAVLENIRYILQKAGSDLHHLVSVTVFLVDFKDYAGMNEIFNLYFDAESGPARTTVAVARLPHPNLLIEIQGIAAVADSSKMIDSSPILEKENL